MEVTEGESKIVIFSQTLLVGERLNPHRWIHIRGKFGGRGGSSGGTYVRSDRNTQFGFSSVADLAPSSGEGNFIRSKQWPNGSAAGHRIFGPRFEPQSGAHAGGAVDGSGLARILTADEKNCS